MRESLDQRRKRTKAFIGSLKAYYPGAHCALVHSNPLELLVATILSAQCTDERVNMVTQDLFPAYPTAKSYAEADLAKLELAIRSINFFRNKAKSLKGMGQKLIAEHNSEVPQDLDSLVALPGVGRKTANVVLGNAFNIASGIVVDTHVKRLAFRLGLTKQKVPEKVESDLLELVPKSEWVMISHLLISHGRQICKARKPSCSRCFLEARCPQKGVVDPG